MAALASRALASTQMSRAKISKKKTPPHSPGGPKAKKAGVDLSKLKHVVRAAMALQRVEGESFLGHAYRTYREERGEDPFDESLFPTVEVAFKFLKIKDVDIISSSFFAEFIICYDWVDPSLQGKGSKPDWDDHFCPEFEFENGIGVEQVDGDGLLKRLKDGNHVSVKQTWRGTFSTLFDLRNFPFDAQYLEVVVKTKGIAVPGPDLTVPLSPPITFRSHWGIGFDRYSDYLAEWDIIKVDGGLISKANPNTLEPTKSSRDAFMVQICIVRDTANIMWNLGFTMLCVMLLSFTSFGIDASDLGGREGIVLTMILTAMAFKWVLSDALPKVPYLTICEKYVVGGFMIMIAQGIMFWPISYLANHSDTLPYGLGHKYPNVADRADECLFLLLALGLIVLHIWAYYAAQAANVGKLRKKKGLRIVEAAEYMCQAEDKKFMPKDNEYTWRLHVPTVGFVNVASAPGVPSAFFSPGPDMRRSMHVMKQQTLRHLHEQQHQHGAMMHGQQQMPGYGHGGGGGGGGGGGLAMNSLALGGGHGGQAQHPYQAQVRGSPSRARNNGDGERSPLIKPHASPYGSYGS